MGGLIRDEREGIKVAGVKPLADSPPQEVLRDGPATRDLLSMRLILFQKCPHPEERREARLEG
jgi:hypothetical protein